MSLGINAYSYKGAQLKDLQQLSYEKQMQYLKTDTEIEGVRSTEPYSIEILECKISVKVEDVADSCDGLRLPREQLPETDGN